jgi:hypothetical protein
MLSHHNPVRRQPYVVRGAHIIKGGFNLRNGREIDHRGLSALNAIPQV